MQTFTIVILGTARTIFKEMVRLQKVKETDLPKMRGVLSVLPDGLGWDTT